MSKTLDELRAEAAAQDSAPPLEDRDMVRTRPTDAPPPARALMRREDLGKRYLSVLERSPLGLNRPGAAVLLAQLDRELGPELLAMDREEVLEAAVAAVSRAFLALG